MIKKTKDYQQFKFRDDNREKLDQSHVKKLIESIKARNMLEWRPLIVNDQMEVIDGQHRLLAAQYLELEVYYQQEKKIDPADIVRMNISKPWGHADYLNFYCQHGYPEYQKLKDFMKKHGVSLKVTLSICMGGAHIGFHEFRMGEFKFNEDYLGEEIAICWDTIAYIKKINGYSQYTSSGRFWKAMLKLVRSPEFEADKWNANMKKLIDHFSPRANTADYISMVQTVYNWQNRNKINLMED